MDTHKDIHGIGGPLSGIPNITPDTYVGTNKETGNKEQTVAWTKEQAAEKFNEGKGTPRK
jgi:hypothetical protein